MSFLLLLCYSVYFSGVSGNISQYGPVVPSGKDEGTLYYCVYC